MTPLRRRWRGLSIVVENRRGTIRKWYDPNNRERGRTKMRYDYGYIEGAVGADGDEVGVYLGPKRGGEFVYVVHQRKAPEFTEFDEDKVMLGFSGAGAAERAYKRQYNDLRFFGGMSAIPTREFLAKVRAADGTKITNADAGGAP